MAIPFRIRAQSNTKPVLAPNVSRKVKRDFRLWLGIGLLLLSILTISHLVSAAGARTESVALTHDVLVGKQLTLDDLEVVRVALPSAHNYVSSIDSALGIKVTRNMSAGELIPTSGQTNDTSRNLRSVSLPIKAGHLPNLQSGDLVDIWSTPSADGMQIPGPPVLLSQAVTVADVPAEIDPNSDTALSVLLPKKEVAKIVAALRDGQIDIAVLGQSGGDTQ
ncbi:MAG: hypothetical protein NTW81_04065 [Actinobacteria bacterium]|nr:hypothetical protein [Actinomycetota bacterium]